MGKSERGNQNHCLKVSVASINIVAAPFKEGGAYCSMQMLVRFGKLKYLSTIVKYYQTRQICLSKVHKMTHEVWNKCIRSKSQQFCNIVDRVVLPELHCCRNFDPSMLHLQVQLHLHIVQKCIFASKHSLYVI